MGTGALDIKSYIRERGELVNSFLESCLDEPFSPPVLREAMRYSLLAGGKRLRPVLVIASYEACGGRPEDILGCAAALEFVHTYSLIHDDLPAMDNDDMRRGRPTSHKVYGEAIAILAGDGLLTEAFHLLVRTEGVKSDHLAQAVRELSRAAGVRGMVGGQALDILSENAEPDGQTLESIHRRKTGALIAAAVRIGGIMAGAPGETMKALTAYGENLGLAFQIVDDILDVRGESAVLGKSTGSDEKKRKMTYPALYGVEASMKKAEELVGRAIEALEPLSGSAEPLREIARYMLKRSH